MKVHRASASALRLAPSHALVLVIINENRANRATALAMRVDQLFSLQTLLATRMPPGQAVSPVFRGAVLE
jgi:hypothetical protein